MHRISRGRLVWFGIYLAAMIVITWGLSRARLAALNKLSTEQAQNAWQEWRNAAREQSSDGPVKRRVPQSEEPPGLVLLRDHFTTSWLILAVLTSMVLATFAWMIRGVILGPKFEPQLDDEPEPESRLHRP